MTPEQIETLRQISRDYMWEILDPWETGAFDHLIDERELLLGALKQIADADHAEDGGPHCDHVVVANAAIAKATAACDTPRKPPTALTGEEPSKAPVRYPWK